jgi:hypothetical protein
MIGIYKYVFLCHIKYILLYINIYHIYNYYKCQI